MSGSLTFEHYLDEVAADAIRLREAVCDYLDNPVPSCPGWATRDLLAHLVDVCYFWEHQVETADTSRRHDLAPYSPRANAGLLIDFEEAADSFLYRIRAIGPDEACWNWSGRDQFSSWVARRMALELAVHRYDGELAVGEVTAVPRALAIDGIDERIDVHLRTDAPEEPRATLGGSLCFACNDDPAAWVVEVGSGQVKLRVGRGPASAVLRGSASDLFLFSWNRVGLERLELTGDQDVAAAWAKLPS